ncbi:MAG: aspartate carbamoyltransferase catalytic subunit [Bacillota bacterium]|nr:MAG: aspartate carbamoyltransferase catalytic subunit [Bacillota bacterium]
MAIPVEPVAYPYAPARPGRREAAGGRILSPTAQPAAEPAAGSRQRCHRAASLTGIAGLPRSEIEALLDEAARMKDRLRRIRAGLSPAAAFGGALPLAGRRVLTLFFENSTRTMQSFHIAARLLGADALDLPVSRSSVAKGESFRDTLRTCAAMGVDAVVIRHPVTGAARYAAAVLDVPVINAGDGTGEHPTQALLDALTIRERLGRLEGLRVAIVGDIRHSRVARSNVLLLTRLGAEVRLAGPPTMLPDPAAFPGVRVTGDLREALDGADVVMALRIQRERQDGSLLPGPGEYRRGWGIDAERLGWAKPGVLVMHPGPVNRGIELAPEVMNLPHCVIEEQVTSGVAVRMAVLRRLLAPESGEGWR